MFLTGFYVKYETDVIQPPAHVQLLIFQKSKIKIRAGARTKTYYFSLYNYNNWMVKGVLCEVAQLPLGNESKAPRSELIDELNRKRAWVLSATALEFCD